MAISGSFITNDYEGRYLIFSWSLVSQAIETNSSTISWSLTGGGAGESAYYNSGNFKVVINGTTVYSSSTRIKLYNGTVVASGSFTIPHSSDGEKTFSASAQGAIYFTSVNVTGSDSWDLPTINRYANIITCSNFTDIGDPSVEFTNPNNANVTFEIAVNNEVVVTRTISAPSSPYKYLLTDTERTNLRAKAYNTNSLEVEYRLNTLSGSATVFTSTATAYMEIVNADPIISGISYADTNEDTKAITGDDSFIIQNNSIVGFTIDSISAQKGAYLVSLTIKINEVSLTEPLSGTGITDKVVSYGYINSAYDVEATLSVVDSRGNTATSKIMINMLSWSTPTALISCSRVNNYETNTNLKVNGSYSALGGSNTLSIEYQYKETTSSSWSAPSAIQDDTTYTISLDNSKAWDIKVVVADRIGSTTYSLSLDIGVPIVFYDRIKRSIGSNCFPVEEQSIEAKGVVRSGLGLFSFDTAANSGSNGYLRIATVTIGMEQANEPIEFKVFRRGDKRPVNLFLVFNNESSLDPALDGLYIDSLVGATTFEAYAYKVSSGVWDIYVKKADVSDDISVVTYNPRYMRRGVSISYEEDFTSTPPTGAISAILLS